MKILYISLVDWFWIKQRPHHFPEILSQKDNQVTFFCVRPIREINGKNNIRINEKLNVIRKLLLPHSLENKFSVIKKLNIKIMKFSVEKIVRTRKIDTIILTHPKHVLYLSDKVMENCKIIYDCMDDIEQFSDLEKEDVNRYEGKLVNICSNVIVSSEYLKQKLNNKYPIKEKIFVINNGVELEKFSVDNIDKQYVCDFLDKDETRIKICYVGTVSKWFDFELIKRVADERCDVIFYIIGPIENQSDISKIKEYSNIKIIGPKPYDEVGNILYNMDITVMPFVVNDLIKAVNPVKIYEYLALGKPVISVRYNETEKFRDFVYLYDNYKEFMKCIDIANANKFDLKRIEFAKENTWEQRVEQLIKLIVK